MMDCLIPPPLTLEQLDRLVDGDRDPSLLQHLQQCPACSARLDWARQFERRLRRNLYRWDCPTPAQLVALTSGRLGAEEHQLWLQHLVRCARCKADHADLLSFLESSSRVDAPHSPGQQELPWLQIAARFRHNVPAAHAGAPRARGGSAPAEAPSEADGPEQQAVAIEVYPAADDQVLILGQVLVDGWLAWRGALVEVRREGKTESMTLVDDAASFSCGPLDPGAIELRITAPEAGSLVVPVDARL